MKNMKKIAIMLVGKTHSGKTTLAESLAEEIKGVVLQTDPINLFLKKEYPAELDRDKEHNGNFQEPSLKVQIYNTILKHILKKGNLIPILANSNMFPKMRKQIIAQLQKYNYQVIGVYLNFSEEFLLQRIQKAKKNVAVLNQSSDFKALLKKQRAIFVPPVTQEFDYFFEVKNEKDLASIKSEIINLTI
jgi:predicted kinase